MKTKWRSIEDCLPANGATVVILGSQHSEQVFDKQQQAHIAVFTEVDPISGPIFMANNRSYIATRWIPLPKPYRSK